MLSPQALIRGIVQRALPSSNPDSANNDVAIRQGSYGEVYTQPLVRKSHGLADEGSYFIINNAQTGITPPLGVGFVATVAALSLYNNDTLGRRLYLDYINLTNIVAVTATSSVVGEANAFFALVIDNGTRGSGGTTLTAPVNPNLSYATTTPNIVANFGNLTASAATGGARTLVGQRTTRPSPTTSALTLVGDTWLFNFGAVEAMAATSQTVTNANFIPVPMPPVVLGPYQSAVLYMWWANHTPAGGSAGFLPEIGFWMR